MNICCNSGYGEGEAVVKTKRAIDYRNWLIGVASIATAI
jgi:hypothetical protein